MSIFSILLDVIIAVLPLLINWLNSLIKAKTPATPETAAFFKQHMTVAKSSLDLLNAGTASLNKRDQKRLVKAQALFDKAATLAPQAGCAIA